MAAPTETGLKLAAPYAIQNEFPLALRVAETIALDRQILERGGETIDSLAGRLTLIQRSDAAQDTPVHAAPAPERKQALARQAERDKADAVARTLASTLRAQLDAVPSSVETVRIKQAQALAPERGRTDPLAREVAALRAELDTARMVGKEAVQAIEVGIRQTHALEQERDKSSNLAHELALVRAELNVALLSVSKAIQAPDEEIKQAQAIERERGRAETLARELAAVRAELDTARAAASDSVHRPSAAEDEQKQMLESERDKAATLARELAALRAELDTARAAASDSAHRPSAAEVEQKQMLDRERDKTATLARELAALRAELDTARAAASESLHRPSAAEVEQKQMLDRERDKTATLARELAALRAELDTARNAAADAAKTAAAGAKQKLALEQELKQQRDGAEALARQLTSLRAELDTNRAALSEATRIAEAAKIEQAPVSTKVSELASARKQAEECSTRLAAAYAEILQATETGRVIAAEQKQALVKESDRAAALTHELAAVRTELEARDRQFAALNAPRASLSHEPTVGYARGATSTSQTTEGISRLPQWASVQATTFHSGSSSTPDFSAPDARSSSRASARDPNPKVTPESEKPAQGTGASHSLVDEQRLLARANALLRQADISGARQLLELALQRGSARAALMLAETYDTRVLQSWGARGIPGDLTRARELYERAQAGGIEDAKERINALK
ncbi:hypothetical protein [Afipia sp. GAS231]|uniref:hypothetical protein n=1 Tax=Afipia sp. GAS231 TaxID=1882747 RepID=UPI000879E934|nr:hypothetical protein [Afipia sp. GAS231]SDP24979.1 hypothetical protein SAMN05444050_6263 [Afipia sp. GAS231]